MALLSIRAKTERADDALGKIMASKNPKSYMGVRVTGRYLEDKVLVMKFVFNPVYRRLVTPAHLVIAADAMMAEFGVPKDEYGVEADINGE